MLNLLLGIILAVRSRFRGYVKCIRCIYALYTNYIRRHHCIPLYTAIYESIWLYTICICPFYISGTVTWVSSFWIKGKKGNTSRVVENWNKLKLKEGILGILDYTVIAKDDHTKEESTAGRLRVWTHQKLLQQGKHHVCMKTYHSSVSIMSV